MPTMSIEHLTSHQLRQAADLSEKIEALKTELAGLLEGKTPSPAESPAPVQAAKPGKRTMSAAHKAAIRAAQARRWAAHRAAQAKAAPETAGPAKKQGGMSAAGKARIAAAQKARWAKHNAANAAADPAKKRKMSAAGRARIIAAVKARWAKVKAAKGKK